MLSFQVAKKFIVFITLLLGGGETVGYFKGPILYHCWLSLQYVYPVSQRTDENGPLHFAWSTKCTLKHTVSDIIFFFWCHNRWWPIMFLVFVLLQKHERHSYICLEEAVNRGLNKLCSGDLLTCFGCWKSGTWKLSQECVFCFVYGDFWGCGSH